MQYQQTFSRYAIGVIVIETRRLDYRVIVSISSRLNDAIASVQPRQIIHLSV
ncbi:MAG: hypothetical protein JOZ54_16315 [Acidobacteria bacterium]|nr:hypothetical protein [Acidobacteriota bacterium]